MTNIPTGILIPSRWVMLRVPARQMTDNAKFSQGVSVFGAEDTTVNSESALNVAINAHFALKVAYNVTRTLSRLRPRRSIPIAGPRSPSGIRCNISGRVFPGLFVLVLAISDIIFFWPFVLLFVKRK